MTKPALERARPVELHVVDALPTAAELFEQYSAYVAGLGYGLLGRDMEVDDLVQDVFLATVEGLASVRSPGALKGWLATLTVRMARRRLYRRKLVSFLGFDDADEAAHVPAKGARQDDVLLLRQVYETLDDAAVEDRVAWVLSNVEREPLDTVATLCGCSLATVKRRIARAQTLIESRFSDDAR